MDWLHVDQFTKKQSTSWIKKEVGKCVSGKDRKNLLEYKDYLWPALTFFFLRYAELEMKIGEIDRARAIFAHCANICNPDVHIKFWNKWKDFETEHGNEDTIREMLRVKRQVAATHNTQGKIVELYIS